MLGRATTKQGLRMISTGAPSFWFGDTLLERAVRRPAVEQQRQRTGEVVR